MPTMNYPNDDEATRYAREAYAALTNLPEFGEETRVAIVDTAAMFLTDAGFKVDYIQLERIAASLA